MDRRKRIICIAIIIIVVIIGLALYLISNKYIKKESDRDDQVQGIDNNADNEKLVLVNNRNEYFDIQRILDTYIRYIKEMKGIIDFQEYNDDSIKTEGVNSLYSILDSQYIEELNINKNNLQNKIKKYNNYKFITKNVYVGKIADAINIYFVELKIDEEDYNLLIKTDSNNMTFSIFLNDYIEKNNYNTKTDLYDMNIKDQSIEKNNYNQYKTVNITDEYICSQYLYMYKTYALNYPDFAYEHLDKEYREKRFGNINKFKEYVKDNKDLIENIELDKYQISDIDNKKQYVCIDKNEFYYIFKENYIMNFSLITDTYTVDIPGFSKFTKTYEESSEKEKVIMNIDKIDEALNMKDYGYVYSKFSDGFKKNYFKTEKDFIDFASKYFKNNNKVNYNNYSKEGNTHICNITLTDKAEKSTLELNTDILMRLQDGTDFVFTMSGIVPNVVYNGN